MKIKVYGANWCVDCINVKNFLSSKGLDYEDIIITDNINAISLVEKINNGKRIIPTIEIEGKIYSNPGINRLRKILDNKA
ncbi:MAG: glutaredoxin family protein [Bacteroidota bacterium]|nr:glutaredoxin family protein [Bacteroidota bacterium]